MVETQRVSGARLVPALALVLAVALAAACSSPVPSPGAAKVENVLKWTTRWEKDNAGFYVFRATSKDGPFERLTTELLPGAGSSEGSRDYRYVDSAIEVGREYFYVVEAVKTSGERVKVTGVMRAAAKQLDSP